MPVTGTAGAYAALAAGTPGGVGAAGAGKATGLATVLGSGEQFNMAAAGLQAGRINGDLNAAVDGQSPRPSSLHPGVVIVMFCDNHGKTISQNIDDVVYASLISSNGGDYGQPILQSTDF